MDGKPHVARVEAGDLRHLINRDLDVCRDDFIYRPAGDAHSVVVRDSAEAICTRTIHVSDCMQDALIGQGRDYAIYGGLVHVITLISQTIVDLQNSQMRAGVLIVSRDFGKYPKDRYPLWCAAQAVPS